MGGSSGGGGSSTASQLPTWISGPHKNLVSKAETFAYGDRGAYVPYTDSRIAGFNPNESAAFGARQDLFNRGDPMGAFAQGELNYASGAVPGIMTEANRTFSGSTVNDYMSPYMQGVIDPQLREADQSFERLLNQNEANSTARGASVGAYRQGLERMMTEQRRAQTLADITGKGKQAAYEAGLGAFQRDRDARMGGAMNTVQAGTALAGAADQVGTGNLNRMESLATGLERSGATQREMEQRGLDLNYSDFTQERDWPMRNMSFLAGILGGVPSNQYAQTNATTAQPGLMSQLASLGLGAAALQQGFGAGYADGGIVNGRDIAPEDWPVSESETGETGWVFNPTTKTREMWDLNDSIMAKLIANEERRKLRNPGIMDVVTRGMNDPSQHFRLQPEAMRLAKREMRNRTLTMSPR